MALAVAIQMDPIDTINIDADSTFSLALEAQARGHALYHYLPTAGSTPAAGHWRCAASVAITTASARSRNWTWRCSTSC
jgi:hypothetical protein